METDSSIENDKKLVDGLLSGDRRIGRLFLERYGGLIRSAILSIELRSGAVDYDDLFMDALSHIFEKDCKVLRVFNWKCKLSAFLYTVVKRYILDKVTRENRITDKNLDDYSFNEIIDDCEDDSGNTETDEIRKSAFNEAFEELDPKDALFIKMLMIEKQPTSEVMEFFNWNSENTVYARKNKVLAKLKSLSRKALQRRGIVYA
jgi:RNA polymerase sigma factor (sigma-70 family)